ncbi:MAG: rhomboid family intramembrane serine protease [Betaproteobacteria bacterium]
MLIVPYQTRFTAGSLPAVTLALILVNALVYFVFQAGDRQAGQNAAAYYFSSDLPAIELPLYAAALQKRGDPRAARVLQAADARARNPESRAILSAMQHDHEFMRDLKGGVLLPASDPAHEAWRQQRERFEGMLQSVFTERFALQPGGSWFGLLTHQFLHGDAMHWFGNMLVLLLAGPFAEAALGRTRFLLAYLFSGACAGALFLALNGQALVGASGAIAGAMAMVAVLYGTRKVPVFYWLFVYFNTARVPALLLLPVWLVIEAVQWALSPGSRVAYTAHIGGFLAGALAAWTLKSGRRPDVQKILDEQFAGDDDRDRRATLLREAQQAAARLDTRRAARAYAQLLTYEPGSASHAAAYFNMALIGRHPETLLDAAVRALAIRDPSARARLQPVYAKMSQPDVAALLPVDEQLRLVRRLAGAREDAAALRVLDALTANEATRRRHASAIADCLATLLRTYSRSGAEPEAAQVKQRLSTHFPSAFGGSSAGAPAAERRRVPGAASQLDIDLDSTLRPRS